MMFFRANTYSVLIKFCCSFHAKMFTFLTREYSDAFLNDLTVEDTDDIIKWSNDERHEKIYDKMGERFLIGMKSFYEIIGMTRRADLVHYTLEAMDSEIILLWEEEE